VVQNEKFFDYDKLYFEQRAYHRDMIKRKNWFYIQHTKIISNLISKFGIGKILDVGCGDKPDISKR